MKQRMEMLGSRSCPENSEASKRPTTDGRAGLRANVVNAGPDADICLFTEAWEEFDYWYNPVMMTAYKKMGEKLWETMPLGSLFTQEIQKQVDTDRRAFTDVGVYPERTRVLGSSLGVSSAYEASVHADPRDVLFTTAFIGKCGESDMCSCHARGCNWLLFDSPKQQAWKCGALYHGGKRE